MKKIIAIAVLFLGLQNVFAQQVKNVGDFTTVKVFDKIPAELIPSSEYKVEVSGDKSSEVEIVNKNGELKIRMTTLKLLSGDDLKVKVYYKELNNIQASEGAIIRGTGKIDTGLLTLNAKEGAKIEVKVETQKIAVRLNTGGRIDISGTTEEQDIVIASGGQYYAEDLDSKNIAVAVNAGGNASVKASDSVDARTRAGGIIDIYGNPKNVDKKTLAGGRITVH